MLVSFQIYDNAIVLFIEKLALPGLFYSIICLFFLLLSSCVTILSKYLNNHIIIVLYPELFITSKLNLFIFLLKFFNL